MLDMFLRSKIAKKLVSAKQKEKPMNPTESFKLNNSDHKTYRIIAEVYVSILHDVIRELYIAQDNMFLTCQQVSFRLYEISIGFCRNLYST